MNRTFSCYFFALQFLRSLFVFSALLGCRTRTKALLCHANLLLKMKYFHLQQKTSKSASESPSKFHFALHIYSLLYTTPHKIHLTLLSINTHKLF